MRIVVPYRDVDGRSIRDPIVSGGIEKFIRNLSELPGVEVFETGLNYQETMREGFPEFAEGADLIVSCYPRACFNLALSDLVTAPIMWICNHTAGVAPDWMEAAGRMRIHVDRGNSLWMISEYQRRLWSRLSGLDLPVEGVVAIDYARPRIPVAPTYDAVTIGRCDPLKDPFLLHRVGRDHLTTTVITNRARTEYCEENSSWRWPQRTLWDLHHDEVVNELAHASAYLSTWSGETFGIAALEALASGVPLVMVGEDFDHASFHLMASPFHGMVISRSDDIVAAMRTFRLSNRRQIAERTLEKHSREKWVRQMTDALERAAS
jgi:hypothetical protein